MQTIDGKKVSEEIKNELRESVVLSGKKLKLGVFTIDPNGAVIQFTNLKKKFGEEVGVEVEIIKMVNETSQEEAENALAKIIENSSGVVVQLPMPAHIDIKRLINMVPKEKDVDVLSESAYLDFKNENNNKVFPPVVGAVKEIFEKYNIDLSGKKIAVVGRGQLVGMPVYDWLKSIGIDIGLFDINNQDLFLEQVKDFDVIISGVGKSHMITSDMVKDGVVLIDAGSSESSGKIVGDIDHSCSDKASYFSSVPGGVGPITAAILFRNLVELNK